MQTATPAQLPRILIVDESRMVRAMISKHIRDHFDFREEADGEAAWQVLVLDHSIALVICSLSMPVLDGDGLLVRVRSSRLARLAQMPMLMISGDNDEVLARAKAHGASDFISRSTRGAELLARIDSLLKLAQAQTQLKENLEQNVQNPETGLFTRKYIELQAVQAMSHALRHDSEVSAMVVGFDNVGALRINQLQGKDFCQLPLCRDQIAVHFNQLFARLHFLHADFVSCRLGKYNRIRCISLNIMLRNVRPERTPCRQ